MGGIEELNEALLKASMEGKTKDVLELLSKGANIQTKDDDGYTPLHRASIYGETETALTLISQRANVSAKDNNGYAPLHQASRNGNTGTALALISKGSDINASSNGGWTPLHCAAYGGRKEVVLALIYNGADIHARDAHNNTPIHCASIYENKEAVLALIAYGADAQKIHENLTDLMQLSMHQAASQAGLTERMLELLREQPSKLPKDNTDALAALAKEHGKHDTAAAIQTFIAAKAIESMLMEVNQIRPLKGFGKS